MADSFRAARVEISRRDWGSYRAPEWSGPSIPEVFTRMLDGMLRGTNAEFLIDILEAVDEDKERLASFRREYQVS